MKLSHLLSRRTLAATLFAVLAATGQARADTAPTLSTIQKSGSVHIGWAEWRPMEYRDIESGDLKGVLIALAQGIAKRMHVKPVFVEDNWSTLTAGISSGKFAMSLMGRSTERAQVVDFSSPLYSVPFTVIVSGNSSYKTFDEANLPQNTIAVTTGSTTDELLTSLQKEGKIKANVVRIKDVGGAILSLMSGKVAAFASSTDDLLQIIKQQPSLKLAGGSFGASVFCVALPKGDKTLLSGVDDAVQSMMTDGTVASLLKQYSIVGSVAGGK